MWPQQEKQVILITGAGTGFGAMIARYLALVGHTVYATMRDPNGSDAVHQRAALQFAAENRVDLRTAELDVLSDKSAQAAVEQILREAEGKLDVLIHNAGHMCLGAAEAFSPQEYMSYYDVNVLGAQRVNRAALPTMRRRGKGLLVWIGSASTRGSTPPFLAPYFAAKAAMDSLAVSYASELSLWGIETCIVVPGAYHSGTEHFKSAGRPSPDANSDTNAVQQEYDMGAYRGVSQRAHEGFARQEDLDSDPADVARAVVDIMGKEHGKRPFRVHVDPCHEGAEEIDRLGGWIRGAVLERVGLGDLLKVKGT